MSGYVHVVAAVIAVSLGLSIFLMRKGTTMHRWTGRGYVLAMLIVNVAALTIYEDSSGRFGVFHYLATVSLATLAVAYGAIRIGRTGVHAITMAWSYAGLVAAAIGQGATAMGLSPGLPIAAALVAGGFLIHTLVPRSPLLRGGSDRVDVIRREQT